MRTRRLPSRTADLLCPPVRSARTKYAPISPEERRRFWEEYHAAYERIRADPVAWAELMEERREWEVTLLDGLEDE